MTTTMREESGVVVMVIAFFFTVHLLVVMMAVTFIVQHVTTLPPPVLAASSGGYDATSPRRRRRRMSPATPSAAFSLASSPLFVSPRAPPVALARIFGPGIASHVGGGDRRGSSSNSRPTASMMMMLDDSDEGYVDGNGEVSSGAAAAVASDAPVATMDDAKEPERRQPPKWSRCLNDVTTKSSALNEAVVTLCNSASPPLDPPITLEDANDLVDIGAVWARMDPLTEGEILAQYDSDDGGWSDDWYDDVGSRGVGGGGIAYYPAAGGSNANVRYGDLPKGWGAPKSESDDDDDDDGWSEDRSHLRYKRLLSPCVVPEGVDLRVYPYPRRFTSPCRSLTPSSILHEDTTYLVVDKPPMLPTQPDASNYRECCPGCVDDVLGPFYGMDGRRVAGRPLLCHRVDTCVGGCVVLSKDARGQKVFSEFQRDRKVKKLYLTLTTEPVPLGRHVHWMWAPAHSRRRRGVGSGGGGDDVGPPCQFVSHAAPSSRRVAKDFWIRCVLEVTRSEPIEIDEDVMAGGHHPHDDADGGGGGNDDRTRQPPRRRRYYQSTVRLVTGRKHQVRAQLASLGCPIVRDTLYGPIAGMTLDRLGSDEDGATEDQMDEAVSRCRVPTEPIGLQAHAILFGGVKAKAGRPWWAPSR